MEVVLLLIILCFGIDLEPQEKISVNTMIGCATLSKKKTPHKKCLQPNPHLGEESHEMPYPLPSFLQHLPYPSYHLLCLFVLPFPAALS